MTPAESRRALLERRFRTTTSELTLAGHRFEILHPASADDLITEEDYVRDERLPYWADLWPSSTVLAGRVAAMEGSGRTALELGCGSGLVTAAAARAGFDVVATDYYDDALVFAAENAEANSGRSIRARHVDWRSFPNDLGTYDVVLASDVLYERTYAALVAHAVNRSIGAGGVALVADPGRVAAGAFVGECQDRGLDVVTDDQEPFVAGEIRQTITVYRIGRPAARG